MLELKHFSPDVLYAFPYYNDQESTTRRHQHDFPEISVLLDGFSDYEINGDWTRVAAGQVVLLPPHTWHHEHQPANSHSYQLFIGFRGFTLPGLLPDHFPFAEPILKVPTQQDAILLLGQRLIDETRATAAFGHDMLIQAYVTELICLLMRALPDNSVADDHLTLHDESTSTDQQALVSSAAYYLASHYADQLTLPQLADHLHVSESHLSRLFKQLKGQSPMNYLTGVRMQKAKTMLNEKDLPVKEVAAEVGYQDPFYFSKLYKKNFGATPSQEKGTNPAS